MIVGSCLRSSLDGLLSVLLAPFCLACDSLLERPGAGPVCPSCWQSIHPLTPPLCERCGEPVASWEAAGAAGRLSSAAVLCHRCLRQPSVVALARSAGEYDGALRQLLHALKYERRRGLAPRLGAIMRQRGEEVLAGADLAVPVPLHWRRRLLRGFNQADDLARALGLPVCRALRRVRATRPQFGLRPGARRRNVAGAFAPVRRRRAAVAGACVVLVDDLTTTGATLRECAEVLEGMGARQVRALTAARALLSRR